MPNLHTHTQHTLISVSFGVLKFCSLRGEGRSGGEGRVKNGAKILMPPKYKIIFLSLKIVAFANAAIIILIFFLLLPI